MQRFRRGLVLYIGYGSMYYENGRPVRAGDRIDENRASTLFRIDVHQFARRVDNAIGYVRGGGLRQEQFDALVSLSFNVGLYEVERSFLLKTLVQSNPRNSTIRAEFMKWSNKPRSGNAKRRQAEADMYFYASYLAL